MAAAASGDESLAFGADGTVVVSWGDDGVYGAVPPGLTNVVAVARGNWHSLALRANGTVAAWGVNFNGDLDVPTGLSNVVAIAAGSGGFGPALSLALRSDGTVVAWGARKDDVPAGLTNVVAISAGGICWGQGHALALRADGTVVAWGLNQNGQTDVPLGLTNAVAIAAGTMHSLALRADGTVVAWGRNTDSESTVPAGLSNVVAIAAGGQYTFNGYSLALRADGTVVGWGFNGNGETDVPADLTNAVALAAGAALRADGTVVRWDGVLHVLTDVTNVVALAAGCPSLAIIGTGVPFLGGPLANREAAVGGTVYWRAPATGAWPLSYQWQFIGLDLPGATNALLVLTNVQPRQAGEYSVRVSSTSGTVTSRPARLSVMPLLLNRQPQDENPSSLGAKVTFSVEAQSSLAVTYQWHFNGADLPGETNSTLMLCVGLAQAGVYSATERNLYGEVTSRQALLTLPESKVVGWGNSDAYSPGLSRTRPSLTNVVAMAAGGDGNNSYHLALRGDGTVVAWNYYYQVEVSANVTNVVAIAFGGGDGERSLALRADGTLVGCGAGNRTDVPTGLTNAVSVAVGLEHSLALLSDGTVAAWGSNQWGQIDVPPGLTNAVAVAAGWSHSMALRADGRVLAWGANGQGQSKVPEGLTNVVAIAAALWHSLALRADGTVVAWGDNRFGQTNVPSGLSSVIVVATSATYGLALRADGTVAAWGTYPDESVRDFVGMGVPDCLPPVVAIAAGGGQALALIGDGPPVIRAPLNDARWSANGFSLSLPTQSGHVYSLEYKNSLEDATWTPLPLVAGTGRECILTDSTASGTQRFYHVRRW